MMLYVNVESMKSVFAVVTSIDLMALLAYFMLTSVMTKHTVNACDM